jgi:hypothetical protein
MSYRLLTAADLAERLAVPKTWVLECTIRSDALRASRPTFASTGLTSRSGRNSARLLAGRLRYEEQEEASDEDRRRVRQWQGRALETA